MQEINKKYLHHLVFHQDYSTHLKLIKNILIYYMLIFMSFNISVGYGILHFGASGEMNDIGVLFAVSGLLIVPIISWLYFAYDKYELINDNVFNVYPLLIFIVTLMSYAVSLVVSIDALQQLCDIINIYPTWISHLYSVGGYMLLLIVFSQFVILSLPLFRSLEGVISESKN